MKRVLTAALRTALTSRVAKAALKCAETVFQGLLTRQNVWSSANREWEGWDWYVLPLSAYRGSSEASCRAGLEVLYV